MRIGITGSNGFLGKHLVKSLKRLNHKIIELDRNDFTNGKLSRIRLDILYHLGTNVPFADYEYGDKEVTDDINNILLISFNKNIKKVIYPSGQVVYDKDSLYGDCKRISEHLLSKFCNNYTIIRFPAIYGPGQRPTGFIHKKATDKNFKVTTTNQYLYIDDAVNELIRAINKKNITYDFTNGETGLRKGIRKYKIYLNNPIYFDLDGTLIEALRFDANHQKEIDYVNVNKSFPFTIDVLKKLKKRGHSLILITKRQDRSVLFRQLKRFKITKYFDEILSIGKDSKNNYIEYDNAIIVGDTEDDINAGKANNLTTIGVLSGLRTRKQLKKLKSDYIINDIRDLI